MKYSNPVIPGFYPDPSICRVNEDYYLVTSTFDYFPGVPVFHSRDLVHWHQIGHCLTRPGQLPLRNATISAGIYAPTLRYHNGRFYMITTNVLCGGHFFVYTDDPAGEWSDPIHVEGSGFDPDLFFDDDGRVYMSRHADDFDGIRMWEIDINTGKLISPEYKIWPGFEDDLCEAPHIYKINGWYYLLLAEGGTHRGHMVTIGRSRAVTGPYESCPYNPILSHRAKVAEPIQATGHADLIQAQDGSWWAVFLGIRQIDWRYHHLGRETFLAPVQWTEDGWPVICGRKNAVTLEMEAPRLPQQSWPVEPVRDDFDCGKLALCWNFKKNPDPQAWSLTERPGYLVLHGTPQTLSQFDPPIFVGRRQRHFKCQVSTLLEFKPVMDGEEAGLTAYMDENHHCEIALRRESGNNIIIVRKRIGDLSSVVAVEPLLSSSMILGITAEPHRYRFSFSLDSISYRTLAEGATRYLSSEVAGGFTGVYFAMYATGSGRASQSMAAFDWFDYEVK